MFWNGLINCGHGWYLSMLFGAILLCFFIASMMCSSFSTILSRFTLSKLWLKPSPNVKVKRFGKDTWWQLSELASRHLNPGQAGHPAVVYGCIDLAFEGGLICHPETKINEAKLWEEYELRQTRPCLIQTSIEISSKTQVLLIIKEFELVKSRFQRKARW